MAARRQVGSNQHVERWGADVPEVVEARVSAVSGGWVRQSDPLPRLSLSASQWSMSAVIHPGARAELDVNAPYQRGSVWVPEQQVALIKSTLMKLPTGSILRAQRPAGTVGAFYRIVDGKQRLEALWAFVDDEVAVPADWFDDQSIDPAGVDADGMIRWSGLTAYGRRSFENLTISVIDADTSTETVRVAPGTGTGGADRSYAFLQRSDEEALRAEAELYLLINGAGTDQSAADLANARAFAEGRSNGALPWQLELADGDEVTDADGEVWSLRGDPYLSGDEGFPDRRWVFHAWKRRTGEFKDFDGSEIS